MFKKKKNPTDTEHAPDGTMSLIAHLKELRKRIVYSMYFFGVVFVVCYAFSADILNFIKFPIEKPLTKYTEQVIFKSDDQKNADYPLNCQCRQNDVNKNLEKSTAEPIKFFGNLSLTSENPANESEQENVRLSCHCEKAAAAPKTSPLIFISITEVFMSELKTALFAALFFSVPFFLIQIGIFVIPALYNNEKMAFFIFATGGYMFFILGALFGYYVVFPFGFDFFLGMSKPGEIVPFISVENYLSFSLTLLFCFGIVFELPLAILVVVRMGLVEPKFFVKNFRYFMVVIIIASAILTPPDPMSMIFMSLPLILLYCVGILLAFVVAKKKPKES